MLDVPGISSDKRGEFNLHCKYCAGKVIYYLYYVYDPLVTKREAF